MNVFKVCTVLGTRPEIIKMSTLIPHLSREFDHTVIFTGQHFSNSMSSVFFEELLRGCAYTHLNIASSDLHRLTATLSECFSELSPDMILVYGDTSSAFAGARAAEGRFLVHIEAGLRCFEPTTEEIYRTAIDHIADLLLCPTDLNKYFLSLEGIEGDRVKVTGSLIVDVYQKFRPYFVDPGERNYVLLTLHREENVETPRFIKILSEVYRVRRRIIFPAHPRTVCRLEHFPLPPHIEVIPPVGYLKFGGLLKFADVVLTDSGGVQEESLMAGTPCITIRTSTERQETLYLGANVLFNPDYGHGLADLVEERIERGRVNVPNPYGVGGETQKILNLLKEANQ